MSEQKPFKFSYRSFLPNTINAGMLLMIAAIMAMVMANSAWGELYANIWNYPVSLQIGEFNLFSHHNQSLTLSAFINDALMAIFFFYVGLEIKRELQHGNLSTARKATLPILAAIGGMIIPIAVYLSIASDDMAIHGAAIPMATDIAFSLGILSLLGSRVPTGLKIFLTALAVVDDIGGILVIAIFYSTNIQLSYLGIAACLLLLLLFANWKGMNKTWIYMLIGVAVWYLFLQSGIHSTIAGVLVAFTIPNGAKLSMRNYTQLVKQHIDKMYEDEAQDRVLRSEQIISLKRIKQASAEVISPLQQLENKLHGVVNYFIMPLFAFASAGIVFKGELSDFVGLVTYAVAIALIVGKFVGILSFTWIGVKLKLVSLPDRGSWKSIAGISMFGGIGFTVSLFIASLSFGTTHPELLNQAKMGIIVGSAVSGIIGYLLLNKVLPNNKKDNN